MSKPMMKCGHAANATHDGKPACAICAPSAASLEVDPDPPSFEGRKASCPYCKKEVPSETSLAFFEYRPWRDVDSYYCGCRGWD